MKNLSKFLILIITAIILLATNNSFPQSYDYTVEVMLYNPVTCPSGTLSAYHPILQGTQAHYYQIFFDFVNLTWNSSFPVFGNFETHFWAESATIMVSNAAYTGFYCYCEDSQEINFYGYNSVWLNLERIYIWENENPE